MGIGRLEGVEIHNARLSEHNALYAEFLYRRQQRHGLLFRDCQRLVNQGRNVFAACMVAHGHADAMITGLTRTYHSSLEDVLRVIDPRPGCRVFGLTMMLAKGRTVFIADTTRPRAARHQDAGRHRHPDRAHGRAHGLHAARRAALVQQFRQPAGGQGGADARRRGRARPAPGQLRV